MSNVRTNWLTLAAVLLLMLAVGACSSDGDEVAEEGTGPAPAAAADSSAGDQGQAALKQTVEATIEVTSPVFNRIRRIPKTHSCGTGSKTLGRTYDQNFAFDAEFPNTSPPLDWTGVPEGTVSIALIMESDQVPGDAWSHWVIWNIPADATGLPEAVATTTQVAAIGPNTWQGVNDDKTIGYSGPCPLPITVVDDSSRGGQVKLVFEYFFRVYALDVELELGPDTTKAQLLEAIDGHVLGTGEIKGEFVAPVVKAS
jgi:hypothetical protein